MAWRQSALDWIHGLLRGTRLTSDDLIEAVGSPDADHAPNGRNNTIGSVFRQAAADGLIVTDGRVVKSRQRHRKGGAIRVWERT